MGIENNFFMPQNKQEDMRPSEKLEGFKKKIWEKAKNIFSGLNFDFGSESGKEKEMEIVERIGEIEVMEKGEEYDNCDDNLFLETDIEYEGKNAIFKMVAQSDPNYNLEYKIDYAKEIPDFQKEAERRLLREAVINEKFEKYCGNNISADKIEKSETRPSEDMFFIKTKIESTKEMDDFGHEEGRQIARTLLLLQHDVRASEMIREIMAERKYASQYELENEFSEDIFNDFDGYLDNSAAILNDRVEDKVINKKQAKAIKAEMEKYRGIIKSCQMGKDEYSLVFNNGFLDNIVITENGEARLSDWSNIGTTQNRELSLINDIGQALESARENLDEEQAADFIKGIEDELRDYYIEKFKTDGSDRGKEIAEAVIKLTKLRTFQEL